jgi:hypothetical protein
MNKSAAQATKMASRVAAILVLAAVVGSCRARSLDGETSESAVIPSPNQESGDADELFVNDIRRTNGASSAANAEFHEQASSETSVPVYVSPFERAERGASLAPSPRTSFDEHQESSHAPPNYAPRPAAAPADLKTSASYGHHHHGHHHGHGHGGWLDMGAWTGGKGSFGWYADYPVGGKHHGYGRR